ncbi:MAG: biopolymer transporter ExbD [Mariprofundales bacterium]|nr:biopolymer transporter ExbD [Mariprofundales bacterium]
MNLRPAKHKLDLVLDITPLIDVVFLMLIFFMVSTSFNVATALKLDLPSSHAKADVNKKEHPLVVAIKADGSLFVDGESVADSDLHGRILAASKGDEQRRIVLRADSEARHKRVVFVLDVLQELGLNRVGIATVPAAESL